MNIARQHPVQSRQIDLPTGRLQVDIEGGMYRLDDLIGFAARANVKRGFLFLSKVLGKHWPVRPQVMRAIHAALATQIPTDLPGPIVFIALAETAIGLGQGVFEAFVQANPDQAAIFLHSSRYHVGAAPLIEFAEAHSHAPRQFLHLPSGHLRDMMLGGRALVLIDDEVSTGDTFVNLCAACRSLNPLIERIHLTSIASFLPAFSSDDLSRRFGLSTTISAGLFGRYIFHAGQAIDPPVCAQQFSANAERGASTAFGRVGLDRPLVLPEVMAARLAAGIGEDEPVLVLGTGEFMHPAFLLALALEQRGLDVKVQSTTRSPILPGGAVHHTLCFADNYGEGIANYLYNVSPGQYRHVFICHETPLGPALRQLARSLDVPNTILLRFASEDCIEEVPFCRS